MSARGDELTHTLSVRLTCGLRKPGPSTQEPKKWADALDEPMSPEESEFPPLQQTHRRADAGTCASPKPASRPVLVTSQGNCCIDVPHSAEHFAWVARAP